MEVNKMTTENNKLDNIKTLRKDLKNMRMAIMKVMDDHKDLISEEYFNDVKKLEFKTFEAIWDIDKITELITKDRDTRFMTNERIAKIMTDDRINRLITNLSTKIRF